MLRLVSGSLQILSFDKKPHTSRPRTQIDAVPETAACQLPVVFSIASLHIEAANFKFCDGRPHAGRRTGGGEFQFFQLVTGVWKQNDLPKKYLQRRAGCQIDAVPKAAACQLPVVFSIALLHIEAANFNFCNVCAVAGRRIGGGKL